MHSVFSLALKKATLWAKRATGFLLVIPSVGVLRKSRDRRNTNIFLQGLKRVKTVSAKASLIKSPFLWIVITIIVAEPASKI